jgi:hypothetical protein
MIFFNIVARRGNSLNLHGCVSQEAFDTLDFSSKGKIIWLRSNDPRGCF